MRAVILAVLACVLRRRLKKVVNFFEEKVRPRRENPGYAYGLLVIQCGCQWSQLKHLLLLTYLYLLISCLLAVQVIGIRPLWLGSRLLLEIGTTVFGGRAIFF